MNTSSEAPSAKRRFRRLARPVAYSAAIFFVVSLAFSGYRAHLEGDAIEQLKKYDLIESTYVPRITWWDLLQGQATLRRLLDSDGYRNVIPNPSTRSTPIGSLPNWFLGLLCPRFASLGRRRDSRWSLRFTDTRSKEESGCPKSWRIHGTFASYGGRS